MPVKTTCPTCQASYTLADSSRGKKVRCKNCQQPFEVLDTPAPRSKTAGAQAVAPKRPAPPPLPAATPPPRRKAQPTVLAARQADDEVTAAPPPRPASAARQPLVAIPVDDDEDAPPRRPPRRAAAPRSSATTWIIVGSLGGVLLLAGVVVLVILLAQSDEPAPPGPPKLGPIAVNPGPGPIIPGPRPNPFVNPPPARQPVLKASSARVPIETTASTSKNILFAPTAGRLGLYYWDKQNANQKWLDLHDTKTGNQVAHVNMGSHHPMYMDLSPDVTRFASETLLAAGGGRALSIWSLPDGKLLEEKWNPYPRDPARQLQHPNRELVWFAFLDRDRLLTVARNGQFDLWDMKQKRPIYTRLPVQGQMRFINMDTFSLRPQNLALSNDRRILALSNKDGFDLFETATGNPLRKTQSFRDKGNVGNEWGVSFSPDGSRLAAKLNVHKADRKQHDYVAIWDANTGQRQALLPMKQDFGHNGALIWWGRDHLAVLSGIAHRAKILDLKSGRFERVLEAEGNGRFATCTPDGRLWYVATATSFLANADVAALEAPVNELQQQPFNGPANNLPRWRVNPEGILAKN